MQCTIAVTVVRGRFSYMTGRDTLRTQEKEAVRFAGAAP